MTIAKDISLYVTIGSEQSLHNRETCLLVETFPSLHKSYNEYKDTLKYAYLYAKTVSLIPTHREDTNAVIARNRRIGLSQSGITEAFVKHGRSVMLDWCDSGYKYLRDLDKIYSDWFGVSRSIKITSVKPSGCQRPDTLVNTSSGIFRLDEIGDTNGSKWQDIKFTTSLGKEVDKFYINGEVETKIINTLDGNELEGSLNHKYMVYADGSCNWVNVENIKVGDNLLVKLGDYNNDNDYPLVKVDVPHHNCREIIMPESMNEKLAWFIGLMNGYGSIHKRGVRISFNRKDNALCSFISGIVMDLFGIETIVDDGHSIYINSTHLLSWLDVNGISKKYCGDIEIPKAIRCSSSKTILAFITGFWRADGGIHNKTTWSICTVSRIFSLQLMTICRAIGINVKISNTGPGGLGSKDRYIITSRMTNGDNDRYISRDLKMRRVFIDGDEYWLDPVYSICKSSSNTYDISVPDGNKYIANGTVSHNTVSLLPGVSPGIHYPWSEYYIRRVRVAQDSPLAVIMVEAGYDYDISEADKTYAINFPVKVDGFTKSESDVTMWEQLLNVVDYQKYWADNQVSVTIKFDPKTEAADIPNALSIFDRNLKSVSFLPKIDGVYDMAPYESITKEKYEEMISKLSIPDYSSFMADAAGEKFCDSDKCTII